MTTIIYLVVGIYAGLAQQLLVRPVANLDCDYRVDLVRDRLVSLIEQPPRGDEHPRLARATDKFSNLLRDTETRCGTADPTLRTKIVTLRESFDNFRSRHERQASDRRNLLAL
ncbi:MAG: hypothetical protein R3A51_19935 [Nannocystaceae bacterium]|nr:hypothetical protein [Myxococcales bacterium]